MTETTETLTEFAARVGITIQHRQVDDNPHIDAWGGLEEPTHWHVTLHRTEQNPASGTSCRRSFSCYYTKGAGHHGAEPTVDELLCCLTSDSNCLDYDGFEEWAEAWEMDTDSRRVERTYRHALKQSKRFKTFIGLHWHEL